MTFSSRDLSLQYISSSYQDVIQRYTPPGTASYILDGLGNVIAYIPTASIGQALITADQVPSSASYALTSLTASYALNISSLDTASYALLSEFANTSSTALFSNLADSASNSVFSMFSDSASVAIYSDYAGSSSYTDSSSISKKSISASYLNPGASIYLDNSYILTNTASNPPPTQIEGQIWWDKQTHTYTIDGIDNRLQIGRENYIRVIAGEHIVNGAPVYLEGVLPNPDVIGEFLPVAYLAIADGTGIKSNVIGLATATMIPNKWGFITTQGIVENVDTGFLFQGDLIYLSSTSPGSYVATIPPDPHEKIIIGTNLYSDSSTGRILVQISLLPALTTPYVGMVETALFSDHHDGTFTIGSASANFCVTPDGLGIIKQYTIPEAGFTASAGLYTQYVMAHYNSGSPAYMVSNDKSMADEIQVISAFSYIYPDTESSIGYIDWDSPGTLLANKLNVRAINLFGSTRESGLMIGVSGSYITITSGSMWYGVKRSLLTEINTFATSSAPLTLHYHSASVWQSENLTSGKFVNNIFDDGINTGSAAYGSYIVNYVYRTISGTNRTLIVLSKALATLTEAQIFTLPEPSPYFNDFSMLVGRIIVQSGSSVPVSVDSAFGTAIPITVTPQHNDLQHIQGGTSSLNSNEYYHLTAPEYVGSGTGVFIRQSGSIITGSISNANTASWAKCSSASIHAIHADSSSYIIPGTTFYVVSGSNGLPSSYIEPYNIPNIPYDPPYKEGRMFYDKDYANWVYYTDQNFKLHVGKEVIWRCYNSSNSPLLIGTPVYISGSTNLIDPNAWPAIADGTNRYSDVIGVIRYTIPTGSTGYICQSGVIHNIDMNGFIIGDPLFLSSTDIGKLTQTEPQQPYESVRIGSCQDTGTSGSLIISPVFRMPPFLTSAGMTTAPTVTSDGSGSIYVAAASVNLWSNPSGTGNILGYPILAQTMSLITGSTNYLIAEISNSIGSYRITTDPTEANGINITRVSILDIYTGNSMDEWDVHQFPIGITGLALSNRINNKDIKLHGYQRESGLTLYTTGSNGDFGITEGNVWYGPNSHVVNTFDTTVANNYTYLFHLTQSGTWHQHELNKFVTGYYDSGSGNNPKPCAPNSWSVNFVYSLIASNGLENETAIVLSSAQFATALEASTNAVTPPNLPSTIRDVGLLVGRLIIQSGSYTPTIESAFSNIFLPSVVTNHESLLGLQGGIGGEHRHLTAAEYLGTGTGVFVRNDKPAFAGATPGHVPYWNSQQQLVLTSSVIHINSDEYVLINSGSSPDPNNLETLLVYHKNTSSVNSIGVYSNVNNFSQIYNQNFSSGSEASTDIIAANDTGSQYVHYIDMGIGSSTYSSPLWPWTKPNDGYILMDGGDLWLALVNDKKLLFAFNNTASTNYADKTGFYLTGSLLGTSSFSDTSITSSFATTASFADTSSISITASFANTSSIATTASYANGIPSIKSGIMSGSLFYGTPQTASIIFIHPFVNNNYSVTITGESSRAWTVESKVSGSFVINSNSNIVFTNNVFWQAIAIGEYYS